MPSPAALELSQTLNWLVVTDTGMLKASPAGLRVAACEHYEAALRRIVTDYAEALSPDWLQNAPWGRSRVLSFCPVGIHQVMVEAGVASGTDDEVVAFWDHLAALARGRRDDRLLEIGRRGERLTLAYEQARTGKEARWVAIDSNQDGFDVLSVRAKDDLTPLSIEVKTTTSVAGGLHLTRNEWEQALDSIAHVFHIWIVTGSVSPKLAVISAEAMEDHIPADTGAGEWREVLIPISEFGELFVAQGV
ncbi:DUF3883 domain-containing protein [Brevundimonas sp.]|uniref:DUF3883 domain-containing protein n=1 Tax=Brevundimonas sp. TaxID=1871086 RepID=UPI0035616065